MQFTINPPKNWIPQLSGAAAILGALAEIAHAYATNTLAAVNWQVTFASFCGGIGLLFAKQHNVTGGAVMQETPAPVLVAKVAEQQLAAASATVPVPVVKFT